MTERLAQAFDVPIVLPPDLAARLPIRTVPAPSEQEGAVVVRSVTEPPIDATDFVDGTDCGYSQPIDGWLQMRFTDCSLYLALDGREIRYLASAAIDAVAGHLLNMGLPSLVDVRGGTALHSALIESGDGRRVLALGTTGVGKSTLALAAAAAPDWHCASDDCALLRVRDGAVEAMPSFPGVRVRPPTVEGLALGAGGGPVVVPDEQRQVIPEEHPGLSFVDGWGTVDVIVALEPDDDTTRPTGIEDATTGEMVTLLISQTFQLPTLGARHHARRFTTAADVLDGTRQVRLRFPRHFDVYPELLATLGALISP